MIVSTVKAEEAAEVLSVELASLTSKTLRKAYREKAKQCHPDHHGSDKLNQWARVSWATECLEHWLKHHSPEQQTSEEATGAGDCRACKGTGRVVVPTSRRFGERLTMVCIICRGMGSVIPEENDFD